MANEDSLQLGVRYLQAGDFDRAEETIRRLLRAEPKNLQGWCLLGGILQSRGKLEEARTLFQEASRLDPQSADPHNLLAGLHIQAGQADQAIACLEEALKLRPFFPEAYNNLGKAHLLQNHIEQALSCFREAIHLQPDFLEAANNLALVHIARREFNEAQPLLERLVQAAPTHPPLLVSLSLVHLEKGELMPALSVAQRALAVGAQMPAVRDMMGVILLRLGRIEEAVEHFRAAVQAGPDYRQAVEHLGLTLMGQGRLDEAATYLLRAAQLGTTDPQILNNLTLILIQLGRWADVVHVASAALQRQPDSPEWLNNLALAYLQLGRPGEAAVALEQAVKLRPNFPEAFCGLGWALADLGQFDRAATMLQQALTLRPNFPEALGYLANVHRDTGRHDEAIACYRKSLALNPRQPATHSNLLLALHYPSSVGAEEIFREHLNWASHNAAPPTAQRGHANDGDPERRLRIGYVSAHFRNHLLSGHIEPILEAHDGERFEVFCYANVGQTDDATNRMQALAGPRWRNILNVADNEVEEMIRRDGIDVLIDLDGHASGGRPSLFARKSAPVQVSHFGYRDTSGLSTVDYRISDAVCDPPGMTERYHTEKLVRLPEVPRCYRPNAAVEVNALPAASAGHVTLGVLSAFPRITAAAIAAWAQVLNRLSDARLVLLAGVSASADQRLRDAFLGHGISADRLILESKRARPDYFRLFHRVDLLLDTFPYAGCTTICDALWMGVPAVTLAGQTSMSRRGASPLVHVGLRDLITETAEGYIETAIRLGEDRPRLTELRATLRERMSRSTLMNSQRFTRQLEEAYRGMWRQWCQASGTV